MKKLKIKIASFLTVGIIAVCNIAVAQNGNAQLDAQNIEYNANTGQITASGSVTMINDGATLKGAYATYNTRTKQGLVEGNVHVTKENMNFSAQKVLTQGNDEITAIGGVYARQADKVLKGNSLKYNFSTKYVVLPQGGTISTNDGVISANLLEGNLDNEQFFANGNVHIVSQTRNVDAYSDKAEYYGKEDAKIILSGNAVAMQDNNELRGQKLTLYLGNDGKAAVK